MIIIGWFSCGVTSAVAIKIAIKKGLDVNIKYCETNSEHHDNHRFMLDCEKWYGKKITALKSERYVDIWDVFEKTGWLVGPSGARCTTELKKKVRQNNSDIADVNIFGFDVSEVARIERFKKNNPEIKIMTPLIDAGLSKPDCMQIIKNAGIEIPEMYRLGYPNANCIGCVKGGAGYWNKIRKDFPAVFDRMSKVERKMNVAIIKKQEGKKTHRIFLDELPPDAGDMQMEIFPECSLFCYQDMKEEGK
jgi:hypothetical protein